VVLRFCSAEHHRAMRSWNDSGAPLNPSSSGFCLHNSSPKIAVSSSIGRWPTAPTVPTKALVAQPRRRSTWGLSPLTSGRFTPRAGNSARRAPRTTSRWPTSMGTGVSLISSTRPRS
jgi:hypothetical protein